VAASENWKDQLASEQVTQLNLEGVVEGRGVSCS
jgi:hypothetical protein